MSILSSCVAQEVKLQSSGAIPHEGTKRNRHCNVPVFLFIRHGEFAPKRNFPQHGTKRNRHCNVPVFCLFGMGNLRPSATSLNTVPKETGTTMCLFFVYSAWGICAQAQLPSTRYQKKQAQQCACFLFIRHGEFAPKRNFPQHGTKRNRHCNVPVFLLQ